MFPLSHMTDSFQSAGVIEQAVCFNNPLQIHRIEKAGELRIFS